MKRNIQENIVHGREDEVPEKEINPYLHSVDK